MTLWLDAQLSPRLARWLGEKLPVTALPVRDVGLRDADDEVIYREAARAGAVVVTKDRDFIDLQHRLGYLWQYQRGTTPGNLLQTP